jgi:tRNA(Ile2) C34 agmatinyltransferase TiaS
MNYKALLNMYKTECTFCGVDIKMTWNEYHYRTGFESCKKCKKKYNKKDK